MFCANCGAANPDGASYCTSCGQTLKAGAAPPVPGQPPQVHPTSAQVPNYLAQSILVTIFCCLPFGIPAIVYAAQVNGKLQANDYAGAQEASRKAKTWSIAAFAVGGSIYLLYFLAIMVGVTM